MNKNDAFAKPLTDEERQQIDALDWRLQRLPVETLRWLLRQPTPAPKRPHDQSACQLPLPLCFDD